MLKIFVWFITFLVIQANSAISGLGWPGSLGPGRGTLRVSTWNPSFFRLQQAQRRGAGRAFPSESICLNRVL